MSDPPAMPADPVTGMHEGWVTLHEMYVQMRKAGWPVLAACCYLVAFAKVNSEDPPAQS